MHPLKGQKKTRQHKARIRATQLARYARIRADLQAYAALKKTVVAEQEPAVQS